jgi:hypothetical protein
MTVKQKKLFHLSHLFYNKRQCHTIFLAVFFIPYLSLVIVLPSFPNLTTYRIAKIRLFYGPPGSASGSVIYLLISTVL